MRVDARITASLAILAAAVWLGGMLALGAIAAPVVFRVVPAPANADAMTVVFRRFDSVAMTCAAVVVVLETVGRLLSRTGETKDRGPRKTTALDGARLVVAVLASGLAVVQGEWLSPAIEALHRAGAVRGVGDLGAQLDAKHHLAELDGKAQAALLAAFIVLHVWSVARSGAPAREA